MMQRLGKRAGAVGFFSLGSLVPGPWNASENPDLSAVEMTGGVASKVVGVQAGVDALEEISPTGAAVASGVSKGAGAVGGLATLWATYENLHAYLDGPTSDGPNGDPACGCGSK